MCKWKEPMHLDIDRLRGKKLKDIYTMKITRSKVQKKKKKEKKRKEKKRKESHFHLYIKCIL